jgi:hypothetical protein
VSIPGASAKRLKIRKITVSVWDGWNGAENKTTEIPPEQTEFEFEVADDRHWVRATSESDGKVFDVFIESSNSTGTRTEKKHLVPEKVGK